MDITTVLKADHRKVDELFSQIEGASERAVKTKKKLFLQVKTELTLHAAVEENILYPRMRELRDLRHYAFEAYEEHRLTKQMLAEISALEAEGVQDEWNAKVKVLMDMVRHHVREEESEMFKALKAELDREELRQMGEAVESFKQSYREPPEALAGEMPMAGASSGRGGQGGQRGQGVQNIKSSGDGAMAQQMAAGASGDEMAGAMGPGGDGDGGEGSGQSTESRKGLNGQRSRGRQAEVSA